MCFLGAVDTTSPFSCTSAPIILLAALANPSLPSSLPPSLPPVCLAERQTPDGSFLDLQRNSHQLLTSCGVDVPEVRASVRARVCAWACSACVGVPAR